MPTKKELKVHVDRIAKEIWEHNNHKALPFSIRNRKYSIEKGNLYLLWNKKFSTTVFNQTSFIKYMVEDILRELISIRIEQLEQLEETI